MRQTFFWLAVLPFLVEAGGTSQVAEPASPVPARELVAMFAETRVDAIAAPDPMEAGTFVAALYIPDGPLLVVKARHPSVDGIAHRIGTCKFRDTYLDLQATPTPAGKFFVQDSEANGLLGTRTGAGSVDVLYEDGVRQTLFNGDVEAQGFTRPEYQAKLAAADREYARVLKLLAHRACETQ